MDLEASSASTSALSSTMSAHGSFLKDEDTNASFVKDENEGDFTILTFEDVHDLIEVINVINSRTGCIISPFYRVTH